MSAPKLLMWISGGFSLHVDADSQSARRAVDSWLKNFDLRHWWVAVLGAGVAIATASIAVRFTPTIFIGLGVGAIGVGEWINHPLRERIGVGFKISGYLRSVSFSGLLLDLLGVALVAIGLWRLLHET